MHVLAYKINYVLVGALEPLLTISLAAMSGRKAHSLVGAI